MLFQVHMVTVTVINIIVIYIFYCITSHPFDSFWLHTMIIISLMQEDHAQAARKRSLTEEIRIQLYILISKDGHSDDG